MTDQEIENLYWGTASQYSAMANHAAVIVKFARMIEQAAIKQERERLAKSIMYSMKPTTAVSRSPSTPVQGEQR